MELNNLKDNVVKKSNSDNKSSKCENKKRQQFFKQELINLMEK